MFRWKVEFRVAYTRIKKIFFIKAVILAIIVSAFGPYLMSSPGIRVEHLSIYLIFLFVMLYFSLRWNVIKIHRVLFQIFLFYFLIIFWISIRSLWVEESGLEAIAAFENILQPLVILTICLILLPPSLPIRDKEQIFNSCIFLVIVILFLNSLLISVGFFIDTWSITKYFTGEYLNSMDESRVWYRSGAKGRLIGIFNQPFEGGLAYSIALLCWVYVLKVLGKRSFIWWILGGGIFAGGWLSGSKVFLFVGCLLALMFWIFLNICKMCKFSSKAYDGVLVLLFLIIFCLPMSLYSDLGPVASLFKNNYFLEKPFFQVISGGRIGKSEMSNLESYFSNVWNTNYIAGVGFPVNHALDSEYLLLFSYGGLIAIFLHFALIINLLNQSYIGVKNKRPQGAMLLFIVFLIITAGFGAPVFTINRVSILIWILIIMCITLLGKKNQSLFMLKN